MAQARYNYVFTWNNYRDDRIEELQLWLTEHCKYAVFGYEIGRKGTPHLQGYMSLDKKDRMTTIHNKLKKLHIKLALKPGKYKDGTISDHKNKVYCCKDGDYWEHGEVKIIGQGARSDLHLFTDEIMTKKRKVEDIALELPETYVKYHAGLNKLEKIVEKPPKTRPLECTFIFGDPGTGKSTFAREDAEKYGDYYELKAPDDGNIWWCDYKGEKSLIIDEFKGWIKPTSLNSYLDKFTCKLNCKGTHKYAYWDRVYITSNFEMEEWWSEKVVWNRLALSRRFKNIYKFTGPPLDPDNPDLESVSKEKLK